MLQLTTVSYGYDVRHVPVEQKIPTIRLFYTGIF